MSANYLGNGYIKPMDTIVCPAQTDCPGYVCALDGVCGTDACLTAGCAVNSCGIDACLVAGCVVNLCPLNGCSTDGCLANLTPLPGPFSAD